jgi:acetyl-CoA C-acetyltransferase
MQSVYLIGAGATPVAEHYERSLGELAASALREAFRAVPGLTPNQVGALYVANSLGETMAGQAHLGAYLAGTLGFGGIPALRIEAAGASGGVALNQAIQAVASGIHDIAVVLGVEKVTDQLEDRLEQALALATDSDAEAIHGITRTAQWALLMQRYMHQYDYPAEAFAPFPVNAHTNAAANPGALYRFAINPDKYRKAAPIVSPLTMLDCSTVADGAATLIIAGEALARELAGPRLRIAGSAVATDSVGLFARPDPLDLPAARTSAQTALAHAGIGLDAVQVFELTDPHGIAATLALEAIGCYERGSTPRHAADSSISITGRTPLATGGGYKARGDVAGANGIYQIVELQRQLRGEAGAAQVNAARIGLAQSIGGIGATVATHVLIAEDKE